MSLFRVLSRVLLIIATITLVIYVLLATPAGLHVFTFAAKLFAPGVQDLQVSGTSIQAFQIRTLHFRNQDLNLQVKEADVRWNLRGLLNGKLAIERLYVNELTLELFEQAKKTAHKKTDLAWLNQISVNDINLKKVTLIPGYVQLQIQGAVTDEWRLQWRLQLNQRPSITQSPATATPAQLPAVLQALNGVITANGAIEGAKLAPKISAAINAADLKLAPWQAERLQMALTLPLQAPDNAALVIQAENFQYKNYLFDTLRLQSGGRLYPQLALNWRLQARLTGDAENRGKITMQGAVSGDMAAPQLTAQMTIAKARIYPLQFDRLIAQLNADGRPQGVSTLQVNTQGLKINQYEFSPINLQATLNRAQPTLLLQLARGAVRYPMHNEVRTLNWQNSALSITQQRNDLTAQGRLTLSAQQYLTLNLRLPNYQFTKPLAPQQALQGQVTLYIQQIAPFLSAISEIQNARGSIRADLTLAGTYAQPQWLGKINLTGASADVPALNLQVRNIQLTAQGDPLGNVQWLGQAQSGQGLLRINGSTDLHTKDFLTAINLAGKNILVSNTDRYRILASPDLQVRYADKKLNVSGTIFIPSASVSLGDNNYQAVALSKDVVFVNAQKAQPVAQLPIYAQIQLQLGDAVHLRYEGLNTQLRGQVAINETPNRSAVGNGQINFYQGKYTYYGQELIIRKGSRVIFNGAIDNPLLNIQAIRQVEAAPTAPPQAASNLTPANTDLSSTAVLPGETMKMIVGVNVQGNADSPQISLFSEPAILDQTNILSYLVLGQPSNELNAASAATLFTTLSSINSGGASTNQLGELVRDLQKSVGLDQLTIKSSPFYNPATSQTQQNTALVLGKALSPKLYISYSVGILEALNALRIRYLLSRYWTLQSTTSSLGNGVDLLYMLERGK